MRNTKSQAQPVTDRKAFSVPELAHQHGVSIGLIRGEVRNGALPARRLGRRVLILKEDWDSYLRGNR